MSDSRPTLLRIPGEIRNNIYSHVIVFPGPLQVYRRRHDGRVKPDADRTLSTTLLPLLLTCRQTHHEASAFFYSHNNFALPPIALQSAPHQIQTNLFFRHFLDRIGPRNVALLQHVVIPFPALAADPSTATGQQRDDGDDDHADGYTYDSGFIRALQQRCPDLESIEFDVRWDNPARLRLLFAAQTQSSPAAVMSGVLRRLDKVLAGAFPRLKHVAVCLGPKDSGDAGEGGAVLSRRRRRWGRLAVEVSPSARAEWERMRSVVEEGLGWRVVVVGEDEEEDEEDSSDWWCPRNSRDPRALLFAPPETVLQSEMHDRWTGLDLVQSGLQRARAWLWSPARAARKRKAAEEVREWARTMMAHVGVLWHRPRTGCSGVHGHGAVPRRARGRKSVRDIIALRRRRAEV
ncbi:hypothetical protein C8A03DRAFT_15753 [Achaetomium macrosporum]|uniref:Uncharacterized protein n=1 Tax=Achaetomium macrosporum TaxID=79813 RepID=A0AAN7C954_9PEZI|nr:hypothetical protein C8A03DRAFT_15753 [Achaetomium macrosporum]